MLAQSPRLPAVCSQTVFRGHAGGPQGLTPEYYRNHETWAGEKEMCFFYEN